MEMISIIFLIIVSLAFSFFLKLIFSTATHKLPPGPPSFPVIGNIIWLKKNSFSDFQGVLRNLASRHGPIITLHVGSKPSIWVTDRSLAHEALVQNGSVFADRPLALPTTRVITSDQHDIHSSVYGPLWRTLRRNLTSEILQPARVKSHAPSRKWALDILVDLFETEQREKGQVSDTLDHLRHAMFCLLALVCFGERLRREEIREIEEAQYQMLISYTKFSVLNIFPSVTKYLLRRKWKEFLELRKYQESVILRFVNARSKETTGDVICYVDTLLNLEIPTEEKEGKKRKLSESEIASLCSEFLNAGTDPTATAMQWIMAVMVKYPEIQRKVYEEMKSFYAGEEDQEEIKEDDLGKMSYLKAVILESLRRHPPGHYLSYHKVTNDTVLGGFLVPRQEGEHLQTETLKFEITEVEEEMEESEQHQQQQLLLQLQQQQLMQQRQQQFFRMQHLQNQQQQVVMSRFPSNIDGHIRPPGIVQNRPVNHSLQNANPNPSSGPNLMQHTKNFQQQQQNVPNQHQMGIMQQNQQKSMGPLNHLEIQFAYQDAWRVCHPDFKRPFASLEDACERLLPYHVVADYEAEEDDIILDSDTSSQTISRCQQWDNNIAAKVAEFTATFDKQAQAFNMIIQKRRDGDLRSEERLMIEQALLQDERKACVELKSELDKEMKAQETRLRMAALAQAGHVRAESEQSHTEMLMARGNPLRANVVGTNGEQGMNPDEIMMMMMMNGWGNNNNNNNSQRYEKEPLEDFLNDEENQNGESYEHRKLRGSGEFDLNTR